MLFSIFLRASVLRVYIYTQMHTVALSCHAVTCQCCFCWLFFGLLLVRLTLPCWYTWLAGKSRFPTGNSSKFALDHWRSENPWFFGPEKPRETTNHKEEHISVTACNSNIYHKPSLVGGIPTYPSEK